MKLKRIAYKNIIKDLVRREVGILIGPRQIGKTTLLKQIASYCSKEHMDYRYYNLELPHDANFFARDFGSVLSDIGNKKQVLLIDEFHYLPNATKLFKSLYDGFKRVKVFASGSSSIEMHKHLKESLAGRRRLYRIHPLSFEEWLPSKTSIKLPNSFYAVPTLRIHNRLTKYLEEFIIFGAMPGLVHEKSFEDKKRLLFDLVATYIQKDIKALIREEDILSFNRLLMLLAGQDGGLFSENSTSQTMNYSLRQVRKDIAILNQTFLLDSLKPFFTNRGRELKQTYKIYFFDTGIRNAVISDFRLINERSDKGVLFESFVFHEMQKYLKVGQELYYWRTRQKQEVDFVLIDNRIPLPIEVKSSLANMEVPHGIKQFIETYPECKGAFVVNNGVTGKIFFKNKPVLFIPHYSARLIPYF